MANLIFPKSNETVNTHTAVQDEFIKRIKTEGTTAALEWLLPIKGENDCSFPNEITIAWEDDGSADYTVTLSEEDDISKGLTFQTPKCSLKVTNLKVNQKYFVWINGEKAGNFTTENNKYRFLKVDGVMNVRDLGGINIKQGLIFRGCDVDGEYQLTEEGKRTFCDLLKIKTELNLRIERYFDREFSVAGNTVAYKFLPYRPYAEVFKEEQRQNIRAIFEFLSDENNYPIYFHCLGGADRTGMIALYLRALLGEENEDILIDYELTSLSTYALGLSEGVEARGFRNRNDSYFAEFWELLKPYSKEETLTAKITAFLLDCGITTETLEKVKGILKNN